MGLKLILFLLFCSFCTVSHPSLFNWVFFSISYENNEEPWSLDREEY